MVMDMVPFFVLVETWGDARDDDARDDGRLADTRRETGREEGAFGVDRRAGLPDRLFGVDRLVEFIVPFT